jgi:DNA-binding response OmpR family regulator
VSDAPQFHAGSRLGLVLDRRRHAVQVGRLTVAIPTDEFAVICVLADHSPHVLTRSEIAELLARGHPARLDATLISDYVRHVRRRLESVGITHCIATQKGVGYSLGRPVVRPNFEAAGTYAVP